MGSLIVFHTNEYGPFNTSEVNFFAPLLRKYKELIRYIKLLEPLLKNQPNPSSKVIINRKKLKSVPRNHLYIKTRAEA